MTQHWLAGFFALHAAVTIEAIFAALRAHVGEAAFNTTETYFWIQIVDMARTIVARDCHAGGAPPGRLAWSAFRCTWSPRVSGNGRSMQTNLTSRDLHV